VIKCAHSCVHAVPVSCVTSSVSLALCHVVLHPLLSSKISKVNSQIVYDGSVMSARIMTGSWQRCYADDKFVNEADDT
jgi:hypothetical protein